jgi:hypothetical protein
MCSSANSDVPGLLCKEKESIRNLYCSLTGENTIFQVPVVYSSPTSLTLIRELSPIVRPTLRAPFNSGGHSEPSDPTYFLSVQN